MRQKKRLCLISVLIILSSLLVGCSSYETPETITQNILVPEVLKDVYVYDQGEILSEDQEDQINYLLVQLEEKTTIEFAVITIPSLNNLTIEQYAVRLGNELGIGKADEDNGILLLVSKTDTKVRLEIGPGLQGFLTDSVSGRILDNYFVPSRDNNQYDDACFNTVNAVINCIANSEEYEFSGIVGLDPDIAVESAEGEITVETIIAVIITVIILIALEWLTGYWFGGGFGDGLVFLILDLIINSDSSDGSSGGFGGGRFNGGGTSR